MCARVTRGVPSCILNIDRVEANMEGVWTFSIDREVRNRNISQTVELEVVMVELPTAVYLQYEDQQVGNEVENNDDHTFKSRSGTRTGTRA